MVVAAVVVVGAGWWSMSATAAAGISIAEKITTSITHWYYRDQQQTDLCRRQWWQPWSLLALGMVVDVVEAEGCDGYLRVMEPSGACIVVCNSYLMTWSAVRHVLGFQCMDRV